VKFLDFWSCCDAVELGLSSKIIYQLFQLKGSMFFFKKVGGTTNFGKLRALLESATFWKTKSISKVRCIYHRIIEVLSNFFPASSLQDELLVSF
jgi:hypothetical protein